MSRPIKFRAWDVEEKEYYYDVEHTYDFFCSGRGCYAESFGEVLNQPDRFIVEQYTGLKDKNGKEIYEGDIARYRSDIILGYAICVVAFYNCRWVLSQHNVPIWAISEGDPENIEIIGNVHENPELLGGEE